MIYEYVRRAVGNIHRACLVTGPCQYSILLYQLHAGRDRLPCRSRGKPDNYIISLKDFIACRMPSTLDLIEY